MVPQPVSSTDRRPLGYVHGYGDREAHRLADQAGMLADLLHADTRYPAGSRVLELGCGVGAQTELLVAGSPGIELVALDRSARSLALARRRLAGSHPGAWVCWCRADLYDPPFADRSFEHLFVCFVLEHLTDPVRALSGIRRLLRPGGTITVIEGDHGTAVFHPRSAYAWAAVDCLVRLQAADGGDALTGRRLQPLLAAAGYRDIVVTPRPVYADSTRPGMAHGFTLGTFTAMVEPVRDRALAAGLIGAVDWDRGIADLRAAAAAGGTFLYTFFRASARSPG